MRPGPGASDDCGCCAGVSAETPERVANRPALSGIAYRVGRHATFKESMLARLSGAALPALGRLRTRDGDDFTIALCDAAAAMLDVLTFYQERIANESYLRTARERSSMVELARLIGYQLSPGLAASTHLAFTLQDAPGAPEQAARPVMIPVGTRVQSVPGPDESPQTFETVAEIETRAEWNAIPAQVRQPWLPGKGDTDLYLAGTATQLQPGDVILILGDERLAKPGSRQWDVRALLTVEPDPERGVTRVTWRQGLENSPSAHNSSRVYTFRQRAPLFGHNAPDPRMLNLSDAAKSELVDTSQPPQWKNFALDADHVDLDAVYPKIVAGSWFALVSNQEPAGTYSLPGKVKLFQASTVAHPSIAAFGLSGKVTRLTSGITEIPKTFDRRLAIVFAQSEELPVADRPLAYPLYGPTVSLAQVVDGLTPGQALAVTGKRQHLRVARGATKLEFVVTDGTTVKLSPGDTFALAAPPLEVISASAGAGTDALAPERLAERLAGNTPVTLRFRLLDRDGRLGTLECPSDGVRLVGAVKDDETVHEIAYLDRRDRATLTLAPALRQVYDRATVRINANVAPATQGESVSEVMGSGDAAARNQRFMLRQVPLTFISADTPDGRASTLEVGVNDLRWREVPSLYRRGPDERVYALTMDEDGRATVRFGDGVEGVRLPSGRENLLARYRKGLGAAGNVRAAQLTMLLTRPLGVIGATNPEPASGGEDPEALADARTNAPLTVLTLDRAVSVRDYEDYARAFAGIAKAHALWIPSGPARGVFLTVAGIDGSAVAESSATYCNLVTSLRRYGDPLVPLRVVSYAPKRFRVKLGVKMAEDAARAAVLARVEEMLRERFGFAGRSFGQGVSVDEVAAAVHQVSGVVAVNVERLYVGTTPKLEPRLFPGIPTASPEGVPSAAELLMLDDGPLDLGAMP